jgi:pilus assembly protein Flp/PilA
LNQKLCKLFNYLLYRCVDDGMENSMLKIISFLRSEAGASSIEYALLAAGVAATIIATVNGLGSSVATNYTSVNTALK